MNRYRSRLMVLFDVAVVIAVFCALFVLFPQYNGTGSRELSAIWENLLTMLACLLGGQLLLGNYNNLWRYAETREYLSLLLGAGLGFTLYIIPAYTFLRPRRISMLLSLAVCTVSLLTSLLARLLYRSFRKSRRPRSKDTYRTSIAIVGAGTAAASLLNSLQHSPANAYEPYCLFDDNPQKIGQLIHGVPVKGPINDLPTLLKEIPVERIFVAIPTLTPARRAEILELCAQAGLPVEMLPDMLELLVHGEKDFVQLLRKVKVDDLLGREPISFDLQEMRDFFEGKTVLVTGGGGSIGSELCRQIANCSPKKLIILDIYENNAYEIQQELIRRFQKQLDLCVEIASVRDCDEINAIFERHRPELVFHAAAHKHVPLMEGSPVAAIKNNVFGTLNLVQAADRYGVERFLLISTDKAVNPTNIMGASKRFCEMILQSMNGHSKTKFVAVRFGNVLGSNGSVVPLFERQIAQGGPLTLTDKRVVRYFMTITEAVQLVLQAGAMAKRSEVFVLDMGEPVKILTLAENLIRLSGLTPYEDIPIIEIGLRPGEKLYEELLLASEELTSTANKKIFIGHQQSIAPEAMREALALLREAAESNSPERVRAALHQTVSTFREPEEVNARVVAL